MRSPSLNPLVPFLRLIKKRSRLALGGLSLFTALGGGAGCSDEYDVNRPTTAIMNGGDWRDEIIYQVIVDRFANGDINNDHRVIPSALGRYQGGDWQGLIDHLDYLSALGVTALWISPNVKNIDYDAGFDGYHGYWTQSFNKVNPHFGTPAKLRELVDKAHAHGMKVILDIVANHVGQLFYYDINGNGQPDEIVTGSSSLDATDPLARLTRADEYDPDFDRRGIQGQNGLGPSGSAAIRFLYIPEINRTIPDPVRFGEGEQDVLDFSRPGVYNRRGRVTNYDRWEQLTTGDFPGGLKDLDTRRADVRKGLIAAFARMIRQYDFDGFRIDTLKHVEHEFWQEFSPAIRRYAHGEATPYGVEPLTVPKKNWFMFGEAFDGDDSLLGEFTYKEEIDSVFYFSQKFQVYTDVVKCGAPTKKIDSLWNDRLRFDPATAHLHAANRSDRFRTIDGAPLPDPAAGLPIYNQQGSALGPSDDTGKPIPPSQLLVSFLDNHDVARYASPVDSCFTTAESARRKLHNALGLMLTQDGIPCVYYGTEQDFHGGNDPENRERMFDTLLDNVYRGAAGMQRENMSSSGYRTDGETFTWLARLTRLRRAYAPLRRGDLCITWSTDHTGQESDAGLLSFSRTYDAPGGGKKSVVVVTNVHNDQVSETAFGTSAMTVPFPIGTKLVDVLQDPYDTTQEPSYVVSATGTVRVRVSPRATKVLVPEADVRSDFMTPGR
ncbi:alpha-amylase family glycosyl hydrolase [Haliangium sp. UPWRP_2]|uniref:alpha-amylase family glycosyl hydrolase n=1 Tax=Haliangium sp. UPWRP_2 TaxID=1931276 RepID=UPI000D0DBBFA|nr:alpha-amylase family glycosyl hydrolase [Haliangium sp. UPWRP_2]PSM31369.1 alpha-amylase [Haliangium sp. UPWRP_2]